MKSYIEFLNEAKKLDKEIKEIITLFNKKIKGKSYNDFEAVDAAHMLRGWIGDDNNPKLKGIKDILDDFLDSAEETA